MTSNLPSVKIGPGLPPSFNSVEEMRQGVEQYLAWCAEQGLEPNHIEMAHHLGCSRRVLNDYTRRDGYKEVLEYAKERIESVMVRKLTNKSYATAGVIFNLTNNYGWKQPNQIEHSGAIAVAHSQVPMDVQIELDAHRAEIEGE
jgi:hypothetical protein